jgi:hypothetical protein
MKNMVYPSKKKKKKEKEKEKDGIYISLSIAQDWQEAKLHLTFGLSNAAGGWDLVGV